MAEWEKVIKGLECCTQHGSMCGLDCNGYWGWTDGSHTGMELFGEYRKKCTYGNCETGCVKTLTKDALALLKAQEPRVMTLGEVLDLKFDDVVYLQVYPTNVVLSSIVVDVIPRIPEINTGVVQFRHAAGYNGINNADLDYYGKTWCCWTSRPTDKQKETIAWQKPENG